MAEAFHRFVWQAYTAKNCYEWKSLADIDFLGSMWTHFWASLTPILQKRFIDSIIRYAMVVSIQTGIRENWTCSSVEKYIVICCEN